MYDDVVASHRIRGNHSVQVVRLGVGSRVTPGDSLTRRGISKPFLLLSCRRTAAGRWRYLRCCEGRGLRRSTVRLRVLQDRSRQRSTMSFPTAWQCHRNDDDESHSSSDETTPFLKKTHRHKKKSTMLFSIWYLARRPRSFKTSTMTIPVTFIRPPRGTGPVRSKRTTKKQEKKKDEGKAASTNF